MMPILNVFSLVVRGVYLSFNLLYMVLLIYLSRYCANLIAHIETVRKSGVSPVVCINHFVSDSDDEVEVIIRAVESAGARVAVSRHWELGGEGAREISEAVIDACEETNNFDFLYKDEESLKSKIHKIATEVYGATDVTYSSNAEN